MNSPIHSSTTQNPSAGSKQPKLKYQVFVSSTYRDLSEERKAVVWSVLQARHIPVGMENFTATDERGWRTITRVIDDTDYYVLVIAGMYGSIDSTTGISWTEREYEYARGKNIPVLAFIRDRAAITGNNIDTDPQKMELLRNFIKKVEDNHLVKRWGSLDELTGQVAASLQNKIRDDIDDNTPRPGWIRGDSIGGSATLSEFARLSAENARLQKEVEMLRQQRTGAKLHLLGWDTDDALKNHTVDKEFLIFERTEGFSLSHSSHEELIKYTSLRNRTCWFKARVSNSGDAAARNVIIDLFAEGIENIIIYDERPRLLPLPYNVSPTGKTDSSKHVHIDSFSHDRLRMRIKLVSPGVAENLVSFGFVLPNARAGGSYNFAVNYHLVEEGGASEKGIIHFDVRWNKLPKLYKELEQLSESK